MVADDLDGDGDQDVLATDGGHDTVSWFENTGSESFTQHVITQDANGARDAHAEDMDGDGDQDVLSANPHENTIKLYESDGTETFTRWTVTSGLDSISIFPVDVDSDGDPDVVSANGFSDTVTWHENDRPDLSGFDFIDHTITSAADSSWSVHAADIDADGDPDVVSGDSTRLMWHENDGSGSFTTHTITSAPDSSVRVYTADVNGDGDPDVIAAYNDAVVWFENDGSGSFTEHTVTEAVDFVTSVHVEDIDDDGDQDVLASSFDAGTVKWFENEGSGSFTTHTITDDPPSAMDVNTGDLDGDGDPDVLSTSEDIVAWHEQPDTIAQGSYLGVSSGVLVVCGGIVGSASDGCLAGQMFDVPSAAQSPVDAVIEIRDNLTDPTGGFWWVEDSQGNNLAQGSFCDSTSLNVPPGGAKLFVSVEGPATGFLDCPLVTTGYRGEVVVYWA